MMRELYRVESGRVIAALTEYAETHPDPEAAQEFLDLAELFANHRILVDDGPAQPE